MPAWEIVRHREITRPDRMNDFVKVHVVTYFVGNHGPFTYEVPAKDFSADAVAKVLDEKAADILKLGATSGAD